MMHTASEIARGSEGPAEAGLHEGGEAGLYLLKRDTLRARTTAPKPDLDDEDAFSRIRCPLCEWQPSPASRWSCVWTEGSPEVPFPSCGAIWNTFDTRGSCPGCRHQWRWTSCLRCAGWSRHEDWYDVETE